MASLVGKTTAIKVNCRATPRASPLGGVDARGGQPERAAAVQFPPQARGRYRMTHPLRLLISRPESFELRAAILLAKTT
jgi:hypothetical protein